ncbi:TPA: MoaD/ThiS family protein, partial [Legionella pneumophila subsp. pneumophila]|nr:MoaD/ThiS family protein [Legionella pneumophila subsp. pneumophila]
DDSGCSKGYISVFVNSEQISSIKDITLKPNDEVCIVTSISGG